MSMPSSSALVDTTARTLPFAQAALDLAAPIRQVAAAVAADHVGGARADRGRRPSGRSSGSRPRGGSARTRSAAAGASGTRATRGALRPDTTAGCRARALTTGGLTNRKNFSPRGAPLSSTSSNGLPGQALRQLARVGDRRRRADEDRIRSVVPADALQPAQDVRQVAAEHAAIRVQLVDHDEAQVLEQLRPARMVRQDARVQHVGIAEHDVRLAADRAARVGRRVAVVGEDADLEIAVARRRAPTSACSSAS